jgi:hypothetical protein
LSNNDPTDHALAAIASILDQPQILLEHHEPQIRPEPEVIPAIAEVPAFLVEEKPLAPEIVEAAGYSKVGPGPMAAIRFKWTVRLEENGEYYVDETIGENSVPIVTGPLSRDAAVRLVDDRESEAQRRFELLRSEMNGRAAAASLTRNDGGEM